MLVRWLVLKIINNFLLKINYLFDNLLYLHRKEITITNDNTIIRNYERTAAFGQYTYQEAICLFAAALKLPQNINVLFTSGFILYFCTLN